MYIDQALTGVLAELDSVMIPASESGKVEKIRGGIRKVICAVQADRAKRQEEQETAKEEKGNDD